MPNPTLKFQEMAGKSPETAKFFWSGGPVELAPHCHFQSFFSGVTAFDTKEGIVLIDSGLDRLAPQIAQMLRTKTQNPIHTAIFTQGHVDHAFGLKHFLAKGQPTPRVIAHKNMPARFQRYALTAQHNAALNARQFGGAADRAQERPEDYKSFTQPPDIPPNLLYDERLDISVGGLTFQIRHCPGETDDHSWIFCPELRVLCPGDLFIWGVPNAGNPQKVQRFAKDWAEGLRQMAALNPVSLGPGHGGPVSQEPKKLRAMLTETAEFLETIHARTVAAMNNGSPPHLDIVHEVEIPKSESPWLQPVYDDAEFIVRNIIRLYGGWWSGRPSELKPATREALAEEIAALAGGAVKLAERAEALAKKGEMRLACHLADSALEAEPDNKEIQEKVAALYDRRAEEEEALMSINIYNAAAVYARQGRPFR